MITPTSIEDELEADWDTEYTPNEAEADLEGFKFAGPGWYYTDNDVVIVLPSAYGDKDKFRFFVYNDRDPFGILNAVINLPILYGTRPTPPPPQAKEPPAKAV